MKEFIKEAIADLKKADGFIYVTDDGKQVDLQEAASNGIAVTPINPKKGIPSHLFVKLAGTLN